jgi:nitrous oxidase accessory protein NosD
LRKLALPTVFALVLSIVPLGNVVVAAPVTLVVDDDGLATDGNCDALSPTFMFISAAEAVANPGDTIKVCPGLYAEQVAITKTLTLHGAQATVDARSRVTTPAQESVIDHPCGPVQIMADNVVLDGFTVQGSTLSDPCFIAGIWTNPAFSGTQGGHQILNNIVQNNVSGIELDSTCVNPTLVKHNLLLTNNNPGPGSGNAIQTNFGLCNATIDANKFMGHLSTSLLMVAGQSGITISNNELVGGTPERIFLANTTASSITGNVSVGSTSSGTIRLYSGNSGLTISGNTLVDGVRGIRIDDLDPGTPGANSSVVAHQNCIQGNSIAGLELGTGDYTGTLNAENNWWGSSTGPNHPSNPGGTGQLIIDPDLVVDPVPFLPAPPALPGCPALPPPPPSEGKGTGGGQVPGPTGFGPATFGFNAQVKGGVSSGHFEFSEKGGTTYHCNVTLVTAITLNSIDFDVSCNIGLGHVHAVDNQKQGSGAGTDELTFTLSTRGGLLTHGQITVHN